MRKRKGNKNYGQLSTLRPARASAAATTGSMASATIAAMAARMADPAIFRAATIYSLCRTGPADGYGAAEKLACNRATVPILGTLGVHRFYTGRIVSGIFQLLTFGGFGIWTLIDLIMIYTDSFKDDMGLLLTRMERVGSHIYMYPPQVKG